MHWQISINNCYQNFQKYNFIFKFDYTFYYNVCGYIWKIYTFCIENSVTICFIEYIFIVLMFCNVTSENMANFVIDRTLKKKIWDGQQFYYLKFFKYTLSIDRFSPFQTIKFSSLPHLTAPNTGTKVQHSL